MPLRNTIINTSKLQLLHHRTNHHSAQNKDYLSEGPQYFSYTDIQSPFSKISSQQPLPAPPCHSTCLSQLMDLKPVVHPMQKAQNNTLGTGSKNCHSKPRQSLCNARNWSPKIQVANPG